MCKQLDSLGLGQYFWLIKHPRAATFFVLNFNYFSCIIKLQLYCTYSRKFITASRLSEENGAHILGAYWWYAPLLLRPLWYRPHQQIRAHLHQVGDHHIPKTEEKAKVVASVWGTEFIQLLAALAVLSRTILNNRMNCTRMIWKNRMSVLSVLSMF